MSNAQHMLIRVVAVAVLVALHWFPHTHAAPLLAAGNANAAQASGDKASDADAIGVATIP